ncbi:MAG TPA: ATP-binding protein [Saprospiraceae bacterium]|nr:ATP-binding protein [Saprospiraceae bacterium]HMQ84617.1 ATP-binding protein [Saprospiraceae bacterium]
MIRNYYVCLFKTALAPLAGIAKRQRESSLSIGLRSRMIGQSRFNTAYVTMWIERILLPKVSQYLEKGKAVLLIGPRQVGKTTLLEKIAERHPQKTLWIDCDEPDLRRQLTDITSSALKTWIAEAELVLIDEAQRVKNIGLTLKLITDRIKKVELLVTGSSSLDLANEINEPLTGRKWEFTLLPISTEEMLQYHGSQEEKRLLHHRLIYGMYPEVINRPGQERALLGQLSSSYLYKDIFTFQDVRKPEILEKLLQALALQIGSEVSYHELAQLTGSDQATVQRYLDLLEKAFVVFRLPAFSRNLRNELKKSRKIYFYDNGIRNAVLNNFQQVELRPDIGALWENFLVSERLKWLINNQYFANRYFWRTTQQQEIDYLEEKDGKITAFEFKWNPNSKVSFPKTFLGAYQNVETFVVTPENYFEFLTPATSGR